MEENLKRKSEEDTFLPKRKKLSRLSINVDNSYDTLPQSILTKEEALASFTSEDKRESFKKVLSEWSNKIKNDTFLCYYSIEECIYTSHPYKMIAEIITNKSSHDTRSTYNIYKHIICFPK
jgi:hypothetical protein